jgi:hypothetical protein
MRERRSFSARALVGSLITRWRARIEAATPVERVGWLLGAAAVAIAFAVSAIGMGGPIPEGHFASDGAIGMGAANMWTWHTLYPVTKLIERPPIPSDFYMHHPMGVFWTVALLGKVFSFSNWVLRFPALVYITATTWLLWKLGRELWGAIAGGLTAIAYVALPITLGYANFHDLEQPVMFGCVLSTWGYVRLMTTWRERYAVASVLGFAWAVNHDWPGYMWGAFFLAGLFVYGFLMPQTARRPLRALSFGRYWACMCVVAAVSLMWELHLLKDSGRISDVMSSYFVRSAGSEAPLSLVLAGRHYRIYLMFTGLAIKMGKLALPVIVARAIIKRDHFELLPLPLFIAAVLQYVTFKQGADVHIFWPHYFAAYFALAAGALAASIAEVTAWVGTRVRAGAGAGSATFARVAPWAALALVGLPLTLVLKDGLSLVRMARETGGRFAEANLDSDIERTTVLRWFLARLPQTVGVAYHNSVPANWAVQWETWQHPWTSNQSVTNPGGDRTRIYILDTRATSLGDLRYVAAHYHVHAVGSLWVMDRAAPAAPIDGYALDEREPSWWQWLWQGPTEPTRSIRLDPWVTWEWRALFGQPTGPAPTGAPATLDEIRIAHNVAVDAHDDKTAAALRARIVAAFNVPNLKKTAAFEGGTTLLGGIHHRGARRGLTLFFVAGQLDVDASFKVHAKVARPPRLSTLPADPADLELASGPMFPTSLWRKGHIYRFEIIYRKRPGTEVLTGTWTPGPHRADNAKAPLELIRL